MIVKFIELLKKIEKDQAKDTGMAMVLICLLFVFFAESSSALILGIILLLINMTIPFFYKPVAVLWLGLSGILGTVMTKVLLTILFFTLVTPIAFAKKIFKSDLLQLGNWKKSKTSVFRVRSAHVLPKDIENPF